jgi:hypothetical protein
MSKAHSEATSRPSLKDRPGHDDRVPPQNPRHGRLLGTNSDAAIRTRTREEITRRSDDRRSL